MPRSVWKGALNFGLVNVPVGLYSATQDKTIHFNQFEEGTSDRIRYKKVNERTGVRRSGAPATRRRWFAGRGGPADRAPRR